MAKQPSQTKVKKKEKKNISNAIAHSSFNREHFNNGSVNGNNYASQAFAAFIVLIIYILIILFIGKFLWNDVLCKLVTITKPADSIWQLLGIAILFWLFGGC